MSVNVDSQYWFRWESVDDVARHHLRVELLSTFMLTEAPKRRGEMYLITCTITRTKFIPPAMIRLWTAFYINGFLPKTARACWLGIGGVVAPHNFGTCDMFCRKIIVFMAIPMLPLCIFYYSMRRCSLLRVDTRWRSGMYPYRFFMKEMIMKIPISESLIWSYRAVIHIHRQWFAVKFAQILEYHEYKYVQIMIILIRVWSKWWRYRTLLVTSTLCS